MTSDIGAKPWFQYTQHLAARAKAVGDVRFEFLRDHLANLPQPPLRVRLSDRAAIKYQIALLIVGTLRSTKEMALSSSRLWLQGHFLLASVGFRMLIELGGQLRWAERRILNEIETGPLERQFERMRKLLFGANSAIALPGGGIGPHALVNVMEFVRAANEARPGAADDYAFLCDCAHPSYAMHMWMLFAGPDHDNWSNEAFAKGIEPLLERALLIAETSIAEIGDTADRLLTKISPAIQTEARS